MDTIIYYTNCKNKKMRSKIACFDLDFTLIHPKSGKKFPDDKNDWEWHFSVIPLELKKLYKEGYDIVIFSNQNGIESGKQNKEELLDKLKDISKQLNIPIRAYLSIAKNHYRKPSVNMWKIHTSDMEVDYENSFYVGDAAGRIKSWDGNKKTKKDFSCSDRKFAKNCGLKFYTEREFFLKEKTCKKWLWGSFDPENYNVNVEREYPKIKGDVIIMVGCPASGKSTFSKKLENYVRVNRDTLQTMKKCEKEMEKILKSGKNVIIDNTNPDIKSRKIWIEIAKKYNKVVSCCVMNTDKEMAKHLNLYREKLSKGEISRIPEIALNIFFKKYEEPREEEGISNIYHIDLILEFKSESNKRLFKEYT